MIIQFKVLGRVKQLFKNNLITVFIIFLFLNTLLVFQQCGKKHHHDDESYQEQVVINEPVFIPEDNMSGLNGEFNNSEPLNPFISVISKDSPFVKSCDLSAYQKEKQAALAEAANDPLKKTIPVEYSISIGTSFDDTAYLAYQRSILRVDDDGITPVYVAPANSLSNYNSNSFHYVTDHKKARQEYIQGSKCFFSTIKVVNEVNGPVLDAKGSYNHSLALMYYGDVYDQVTASSGLSPRLFTKLSVTKVPQIIPLYVADFREQRFPGIFSDNFPLVNRRFASSGIRRREYQLSTSDIFELRNLFLKRFLVEQKLSSSAKVGNYNFSAYEGTGQLLKNIIFAGFPAVLMSVQYTPIILDLGEKGIRTSSTNEGSFFNLANLERIDVTDQTKKYLIHHLTSWVGGILKNISCDNCTPEWRRTAQDGILVYSPGTYTKQYIGKDLIGASFTISGNSFGDGFRALRILGNKNCKSSKIKERYIGPWDGKLYSDTLKVWVDKNRDGNNDPNETLSLGEAGVIAINSCNILHKEETDQFGNNTSIRAAFLYGQSDLIKDEPEILNRITTGKDKLNNAAEFRVAIDIIFKPIVNMYLESIDPKFIYVPYEEKDLSITEAFKGKKNTFKIKNSLNFSGGRDLILGNQDSKCSITPDNDSSISKFINYKDFEILFDEDNAITESDSFNRNTTEKSYQSKGKIYYNSEPIASITCSEVISQFDQVYKNTLSSNSLFEIENSENLEYGNLPKINIYGMRSKSACRILNLISDIPNCVSP